MIAIQLVSAESIRKIIFNRKFKFQLVRHMSFWVFISLYFISFGIHTDNYYNLIVSNFIFLPLDIITTYVIIYYLFVRHLTKNQHGLFFLKCLIVFAIYEVLNFVIEELVSPDILNFSQTPFVRFTSTLRAFIIINTPAVLIKSLKSWYLSTKKNQKLEKRKIEIEKNLLKAQLHPHFLFNTLNNLYAMSLDKSERVPDAILKISEILRYILNDYYKTVVPLNDELEIIKAYIQVERLRYHDNDLKIEYIEDFLLDTKNKIEIPQLLIFTFIENAFKHGVSKSLSNPWINIKIKGDKRKLILEIKNSVDEYILEDTENKVKIGLVNVKTRLDLYYSGKYFLKTNREKDHYCIYLEIKRPSHEN